jgi:hypothetical protein
MLTTIDETGRLNNYATEPEMYFAAFPSLDEQRRYWQQGGLALLLVSTVTLVAVLVS